MIPHDMLPTLKYPCIIVSIGQLAEASLTLGHFGLGLGGVFKSTVSNQAYLMSQINKWFGPESLTNF